MSLQKPGSTEYRHGKKEERRKDDSTQDSEAGVSDLARKEHEGKSNSEDEWETDSEDEWETDQEDEEKGDNKDEEKGDNEDEGKSDSEDEEQEEGEWSDPESPSEEEENTEDVDQNDTKGLDQNEGENFDCFFDCLDDQDHQILNDDDPSNPPNPPPGPPPDIRPGDHPPGTSESEKPRSDKKDADKEPLYENASISVLEAVFYIMEMYIMFQLKKVVLLWLLNLLQKLLPESNKLPATLYLLFKFVDRNSEPSLIKQHFFCKKCKKFVGTGDKMKKCPKCNKKKFAMFYTLDFLGQIKNLFENYGLADKLKPFSGKSEGNGKNDISDITDGSEYIRVNMRKKRGQYDLTLTLNSDGLALVKSSGSHCWPVIFSINELPYPLRESILIFAGVW